jgi:hypothetical protein
MVETSTVNRVTLVVITAVAGDPLSEMGRRAFCTAIAETPSMAATIAIVAVGSRCGPAAMQSVRKSASSRKWSSSRGCSLLSS